MTSYRQLQSDDASDQFDLDAHHESFKPQEEAEVQIEPSRARTGQSRVRLRTTNCSKNKVILILMGAVILLILILALTIYKIEQHGASCHNEDDHHEAGTPKPTTVAATTTVASTVYTTTGVATTQATATNGDLFPWTDPRLPSFAKPSKYEIFLHPNLTTFEVKGNVSIHIHTSSKVDFIILHAKDMNISAPVSAELVDQEKTLVAVDKLLFYEKNEQISVHFLEPIKANAHCILTLEFNYTLTDGLDGFYRSSYKKNGLDRYVASTQFEATSARKAFPCFDEPALKANFSLKMVHSRDYITLFNMEAEQRDLPYVDDNDDEGRDLVHDVYPSTVPMSTYLVAFVVCDFKNISDVTYNNTQVAVYTQETQIPQAQLALEVVSKTIPFYEQYFDTKYPLNKQDMIAIPDFSAGAMENWGLITYREASILYQPNVTSSWEEVWIVLTITHELAHQWFGNLVTMDWWSDLWLNEGFASFVEYIGTNNFDKKYHMNDMFIILTTHRAMAEDQKANSHPISIDVVDPAEISEIFDSISYSKGATILKMLQSFLMRDGEDIMIKGIQAYLQTYKYSNARTADLWNSITDVAQGVDVGPMMDTWTLQMGFPVVSLTRVSGRVTATQQRFLIYPDGEPSTEFNSTYGYKWTVPLTYFTDGDRTVNTKVFPHDEDSISLDIGSSATWFKANCDQSGMYRVNYDLANWNALTTQLLDDHTAFTASDRVNLIDDAFQLAWAGHINYSIPLDMTRYLAKETEFVAIDTALESLAPIGDLLYGREGYTYYKEYVLQLFDERVKTLGYIDSDTDLHLDRLLRDRLLGTFRHLGHRDTQTWAVNEFSKWMANNATSVGVNLQNIVRCGGLQYGHQTEWDHSWAWYQTTTSATEKTAILRALACTQDPALLTRYLHWSLDSTKVRQQDSELVIQAVAGQQAGGYLTLSFLIENWDKIMKEIGQQPFVMSELIIGTTSWISTEFEFQVAKQFLEQHKDDAEQGTRALRQAMQDISMRIAWRKNHAETVTEWFKQAVSSTTSSSSSSL